MHITLTVGVCMQVIEHYLLKIGRSETSTSSLTLPVPSQIDEGCGGTENDFFQGTNRTITTTVNH